MGPNINNNTTTTPQNPQNQIEAFPEITEEEEDMLEEII